MDEMKVGDVISLHAHWSVPPDLVGKFFRVETIGEDGTVKLSWPCLDPELNQPYHPVRPQR